MPQRYAYRANFIRTIISAFLGLALALFGGVCGMADFGPIEDLIPGIAKIGIYFGGMGFTLFVASVIFWHHWQQFACLERRIAELERLVADKPESRLQRNATGLQQDGSYRPMQGRK